MHPPLHLRHKLPQLLAFAVFAVAAGALALAAQPPETEDPKAKPSKKIPLEDEDPKAAPKKKIVVDDPDTKTKSGGPSSLPDQKLDELIRASADTPHATLKALFDKFSVPFDQVTDKSGKSFRAKPIPLYRKDPFPKEFGVSELGPDNQEKAGRNMGPSDVRKIEHFEELALAEAEALLKPPPVGAGPTADDQLAAAEKLTAAALRFHDYARQNNKRQGKSWEDVRRSLAAHLQDVRLRQLRAAVVVADWPRVRAFGTRLLVAYPNDAAIVKEVASARVAEAEVLIRSKEFLDKVKARELLDEVEGKLPGAGGEPAQKVRRELSAEARRLYERAVEEKKAGHLVDARNEVTRADSLDPSVPGLKELKRELGAGSAVLYVGVRTLPERLKLTPGTARFDSERQAVELLFEGLLEEVPDGPGGTRYRPGAAQSLPTVVASGREFLIRQVPQQGQEGFEAHDVVETLKMLRVRPELWSGAALPWIDDLPAVTGSGGLRITFRHGHPDPRSLLTFKVLPARWLTDQGKSPDDPQFIARPFGTGPYRIHSVPDPSIPGPRQLVFADNPAYGRSKDRIGLPHIREIRLVDLTSTIPLEDFRNGRLHIIPDLTPTEMSQVLNQGLANPGEGKGTIVTAATNRRVHILAVNHRRLPFQNKDLRKGLSQVIDREGIVNELFRAQRPDLRQFTAAMSGPFPPASWATVKGPAGQPISLLNRDEGLFRLQKYLAIPGSATEFKLTYPAGDDQTREVCERIKSQVESLFRDAPEGRKLTLTLDPQAPEALHQLVKLEQRFDLAYIPFDYPDDWYPYGLAAFLDPTASGRDGRNLTGFSSPGVNPSDDDRNLRALLDGLQEHSDFNGDIVTRATKIHNDFNTAVPFIPLWQVDRHMLVSNKLQVFVDDSSRPVSAQLLNPTILFQNVAAWRLGPD